MRFKGLTRDVRQVMRIGQLAAAAGVSVRALRYYEEQGLLVSTRTPGGQRLFVDADVERVRMLQALYAAGMPSRAIADVVLPCMADPTIDHGEQVWTRMVAERDRISAQITTLERTRDALETLIAANRTFWADATG